MGAVVQFVGGATKRVRQPRNAWKIGQDQGIPYSVYEWAIRQPNTKPKPRAVKFSDEISSPARRGLYYALDGMLSSLAPKGSKRCKSVANEADRGLAHSLAEETPHSAAAASEIRNVLRARCSLCPAPCGFILPVGV